MGIAERVVPQIINGKTKTYRIRDHELKVGDKVYFENSATGKIFGLGTITESTKTKVKDLPLRDIAHGAVYKSLDELIEAFKFHYPEKEINPETDAYIYAYEFVPKEKFENCDIKNSIKIENLKFKITDEDIYVGTTPPSNAENWTRDEDVLDTWFSSALWPFSTLGWPNSSDVCRQSTDDQRPTTDISDYEYFYPTTVMETGYDILFFWVARMIMTGLELTGKAPFKTVYLHGLVRDEQNRKMSKSLGNVIEPLEVSDKFGTDAVRMSLVVGTSAGADSKIGEGKIKGYRNFSNKIWNIARFVITNLASEKLPARNASQSDAGGKVKSEKLEYTEQDKKDLGKLGEIVKKATKYLDEFKFSRAGELLYEYIWHEFADKIIEESKERLAGEDEEDKKACLAKLVTILITILKLLHPFVPFVTETIWQEMPEDLKDEKLLISAKWPE
jgi:valyl-tRNA synthetase